MKFTINKKASSIMWAIIYSILVVGICCSSCFLFHSYYYKSIFVSGPSMQPTLQGGRNDSNTSDFGIIDTTTKALKKIKRFSIVTTYFPWSDLDTNGHIKKDAEYKIKRVIALPGEAIKINNQYEATDFEFHIRTTEVVDGVETTKVLHYDSYGEQVCEEDNEKYIKVPFNRTLYIPTKMHYKNTYPTPYNDGWYELGNDEYWVMGDNLSESTDSAYIESGKNHGPVKFDNLVGVLVAIEGTCTLVAAHYDENHNLVPATCKNRKYHLPKIY